MQHLDVQGKGIELYFNRKSSYTSKIGGFLTLVLLLVFLPFSLFLDRTFFTS